MTEAHIDRVTLTGVVEGWARDPSQSGPIGVEFWLAGECVGATTAASFRSDLLASGLGHGHYAFLCQIRPRSARHGLLELREIGSDATLVEHEIAPGKLVPGGRRWQSVESLLPSTALWSLEDVATFPTSLQLEENLAEFGARRFVGMVHWFLLGRWPDETDYARHVPGLERGQVSATEDFMSVVNSEERQKSSVAPLGPYDPRFPFRLGIERRNGSDLAAGDGDIYVVRHHAYLSAAELVSSHWSEPDAPIQYYHTKKSLLCHPPAAGPTIGKVENIPISGLGRVMVRASVGHASALPIEFSILLASHHVSDATVEARLLAEPGSAVTAADWSGWHPVPYGSDQVLQAECEIGAGPAKLYFATRMRPGAANNAYAWALFSDLSVIEGDNPVRTMSLPPGL